MRRDRVSDRFQVQSRRHQDHDWSEIGVADGVPDLSASQACAHLGERADLLGEVLDLTLEPFTHIGPDNAEFVDDQANTRQELDELLAHTKRREFVSVSPNQDKAGEVASVRLQEARFEALDHALVLQPRVPAEGFLKQLRRLLLASTNDVIPTDEETPASPTSTS